MKYPLPLLSLINLLKRLPGVGNKTAERYAFSILSWKEEHQKELAHALFQLKEKIGYCPECGCLKGEESCHYCTHSRAGAGLLCVVATPRDVFSIDETGEYRGLYHVLGGLLSPLEGLMPETLSIAKLMERIEKHEIKEIVLGLDSTLEGDATALYLKKELTPLGVHVTRFAFGIPMGSSLDYIDGGTLARALSARSLF